MVAGRQRESVVWETCLGGRGSHGGGGDAGAGGGQGRAGRHVGRLMVQLLSMFAIQVLQRVQGMEDLRLRDAGPP